MGGPHPLIGLINPIRYRGYYYDIETDLYYLNLRYYDPETCRFINADGLLSTGQGVLATNMFAYCGNNPVNRADPSGQNWIDELVDDAIMWDEAMRLALSIVFGNFSGHPALDSNYLYFYSETAGDPKRAQQIKQKPETIILGGNMFYQTYP